MYLLILSLGSGGNPGKGCSWTEPGPNGTTYHRSHPAGSYGRGGKKGIR